MYTAFVISSAGATAGIAVREKAGVHFFASEPILSPLQGRLFPDLSAVEAAIAGLKATAHQGSEVDPQRKNEIRNGAFYDRD
jgi:hypothetical protein